MNDLQTQMNRVVTDFVVQITQLARRAAIDTLEGALGKRSDLGHAHGQKRTEAELDELSARFLAFVAKNPGLRIEQINKQIGTSTKVLALPIRKLIADGSLKTKGEKRSTTYFASEKKKS